MARGAPARRRLPAGDQEPATKAFPLEEFEEIGYNGDRHGQKGFNGVAILADGGDADRGRRARPARRPDDEHARYIEADVRRACVVRVATSTCPTATRSGTDKFDYKLAWMERLRGRMRELLALEEPSCWPATST